jgi:glutamate synthase domain-containing protein 3
MDVRQLLFASMSPYSKPKVLIQPETGCSAAEDALISRLEMTRTHTQEPGKVLELATTISNRDLTFGAALSAHLLADPGLRNQGNAMRITCSGTAGQSFGAFLADGVELVLIGAANDGVGKGLSGGTITIRSHRDIVTKIPQSLAGNACFYGATSGKAFIGGQAGDRFAVRNSGATLVVDGVGDHGCEYMTGGVVVILGGTGKNLCAGMTGGRVFVFRDQNRAPQLKHSVSSDAELVEADLPPQDQSLLHTLLVSHAQEAKSPLASEILLDWPQNCRQFFVLIPSASASGSGSDRQTATAPTDGHSKANILHQPPKQTTSHDIGLAERTSG